MAVVVIVVVVGVIVIASIAEINAQSGPYRQMVNRSFGALASPLVNASTQTGRDLATTMKQAAGASTNRNGLQQKLDQAVADASSQSSDAASLVPPSEVGSLDQQLVAVFAERAAAATSVRSAVDGLLGMTPLPAAGAPVSTSPTTAPPVTATQATTLLSAAGAQISRADADFASVRRALARADWTGTPAALVLGDRSSVYRAPRSLPTGCRARRVGRSTGPGRPPSAAHLGRRPLASGRGRHGWTEHGGRWLFRPQHSAGLAPRHHIAPDHSDLGPGDGDQLRERERERGHRQHHRPGCSRRTHPGGASEIGSLVHLSYVHPTDHLTRLGIFDEPGHGPPPRRSRP